MHARTALTDKDKFVAHSVEQVGRFLAADVVVECSLGCMRSRSCQIDRKGRRKQPAAARNQFQPMERRLQLLPGPPRQ